MGFAGVARGLGQAGNELGEATFGLQKMRLDEDVKRAKIIADGVRLKQLQQQAMTAMAPKPHGAAVRDPSDGKMYQPMVTPDGRMFRVPASPEMSTEEAKAFGAKKVDSNLTQKQIDQAAGIAPKTAAEKYHFKYGPNGVAIEATDKETGKPFTPLSKNLPDDLKEIFKENQTMASQNIGLRTALMPYINDTGPMPVPGSPNYEKEMATWSKKLHDAKMRDSVTTMNAKGRSYAYSKIGTYLDTYNGNALVNITAGEALHNPQYVAVSPGAKAIAQTVTKDDVLWSVGKVKTDLVNLGAAGWDQNTRLAMAENFTDEKITKAMFYSQFLKGDISKEQSQIIIDLGIAKEAFMGTRSILGIGAATDAVRAVGQALLPGAGTPTVEYAKMQMDAVEGLVRRATRGIPKVFVPPGGGIGEEPPPPPGVVVME
jgi:hypothetical protein